MAEQTFNFRQVIDPHDRALREIARIYVESIHESGRKPAEWISQVVKRQDYAILVAELSGRTLGFAILFHAQDEPMALLEYLAVDETYRGKGVGGALVSHAFSQAAGRSMLIEVESVTESTPPEAESARRQDFYRRLGCRRISGLKYLLPLDTSPPPMDLLIANAPEKLSSQELAKWLSVIYRQVYGRAVNDERLGRMVNQISPIVQLD